MIVDGCRRKLGPAAHSPHAGGSPHIRKGSLASKETMERESSLFYVTGISGAGKTSVGDALIELGYESHDVDREGFAAHYHTETGKRADRAVRTREFHDAHDWKMSRSMVEELAEKAKGKIIFLCGVVSNENEVWDLFDRVVALTVDEQTLRERLASRDNNEFGKSEDELQMVLEWHKLAEEQYRKHGAIVIDGTQPLEDVVERILEAVDVKRFE